MAKKSTAYKPGKVTSAVPVTETITDAKFQAGDRVIMKRVVSIWGGGESNTGIVRSVKRQGTYEYAVMAADPYGSLVMPDVSELTKLAAVEPEKAG